MTANNKQAERDARRGRKEEAERARRAEASRIAELVGQADFGEGRPASLAADEFTRLWDRARDGRIITPERIRALAPALLEIVEEIEEIEETEREAKQYEQMLTPEEAADLAGDWTMPFFNDDESIGELLLLLRSLTYSDEREDILQAVEGRVMPYSLEFGRAADKIVRAARPGAGSREAEARLHRAPGR